MANPVTPVSVLQQVVQEQVASGRVSMNTLLKRVEKRSWFQDVIKWPANVSTDASSFRSTTANAAAASSDTVVGASLSMGNNAATETITIQKTDITQALATAPGALKNLFQYQVTTHLEKIMKSISAGIYLGNGTNYGDMVGLQALSYNTTSGSAPSYAGISGVTYPSWSACVDNPTTARALSADIMFNMEVLMARKGGSYTAIYTTPEVVAKYKKLFDTSRNLSVMGVNGPADIGHAEVAFAGRPVFMDNDCPANTIYFLNEPNLAVYTYTFDGVGSESGLNVQVAELPISNSLAVSYEVSVIPQFQIYQAKHVGIIGNLS